MKKHQNLLVALQIQEDSYGDRATRAPSGSDTCMWFLAKAFAFGDAQRLLRKEWGIDG